jgi:hypothetical protein
MGVQNESQPDRIKIEIERDPENAWAVRCGDRYEERLSADEALWCVVRLMTGSGVGYLQTAEQHAEWDARYKQPKPLEPWQRQLAPVIIECPNCEPGTVGRHKPGCRALEEF